MPWYCARSKPGQDAIAVENLTRQNFEVYYPRNTIERERKGRVVREYEPLFPSYVLICFTLETAAWQAINSTRGILRLISFNNSGVPSPANQGEIERLRERERNGDLFISEIKRIRRNDLVRMKFGLDTKSIGLVLRTRAERIEFLFSCFGRQTRVIAPSHALEVVGHADSAAVR